MKMKKTKRLLLSAVMLVAVFALVLFFPRAFGEEVNGATEPTILSVTRRFDAIKKGSIQEFTIRTSADATRLAEYAEDGKTLVKTWKASEKNSTVSGNVRTWVISQLIENPGKRSLTFRPGTDDSFSSVKKTVSFSVEEAWVNEASVKLAMIGAGGTQTFTVKTSTNTQNLKLYAEGKNLVKTWAASGNSKVEGDVRIWTVRLAIATAGNRELTLKACKTTTPSELSKSVKFTVVEKKILSVTPKYSSITKTSVQGFTVTTSADIRYLKLYAEDGKALVKTWNASGNSKTDEGNIRTWYVMQPINTAGNRKLVFKGGTTESAMVSNAVTAAFKVESAGVLTASAKYPSVVKEDIQTFIVTTTVDATRLEVYSETGKYVAAWNNKKNTWLRDNNTLEWEVYLQVNDPGKRTLTFKAGKDKVTSAQRAASFTVTNEGNFIRPVFTRQPSNIRAVAGEVVEFVAGADGEAPISHYWQEWDKASNQWVLTARGETPFGIHCKFTASAEDDGATFRCAAKDDSGRISYSNTVVLTIIPEITKQPVRSVTVVVGDSFCIETEAEGKGELKYQWQTCENGASTWVNCGLKGAQTPMLSVDKTDLASHGRKYRCAVTDANGKTAYSGSTTLYIKPRITKQPVDAHPDSWDEYHFSIEVYGNEPMKYEWQFVERIDDKLYIRGRSSSDKNTYWTIASFANGCSIRCVVTDANGMTVYSDIVDLIKD